MLTTEALRTRVLRAGDVVDQSIAVEASMPRVDRHASVEDLLHDLSNHREGVAVTEAGQEIAYMRDLEGTIIHRITSPQAAFVIGVRALPRVFAGDNLFVLT